jgi:23S rRNA pseudouridine1911/1915/1917 synthase
VAPLKNQDQPLVVLEDNHLIFCSKPAGMPVQPDATGDLSLVDWTAAYLKATYNKPGDAFVGLVHRLDRPVSGLCMLTKTSKALVRLNEAVRDRKVSKRYLAIVDQAPEIPEATLTDFLIKDGGSNTSRRVSPQHKMGQKAVLRYRLIAQVPLGWLLEIELETGRHHQIRVQLSTRKMAIVGDVKYGCRRPYIPGAIALHAHRLSLEHPVQNTPIDVFAPFGPAGSFPIPSEWPLASG